MIPGPKECAVLAPYARLSIAASLLMTGGCTTESGTPSELLLGVVRQLFAFWLL